MNYISGSFPSYKFSFHFIFCSPIFLFFRLALRIGSIVFILMLAKAQTACFTTYHTISLTILSYTSCNGNCMVERCTGDMEVSKSQCKTKETTNFIEKSYNTCNMQRVLSFWVVGNVWAWWGFCFRTIISETDLENGPIKFRLCIFTLQRLASWWFNCGSNSSGSDEQSRRSIVVHGCTYWFQGIHRK